MHSPVLRHFERRLARVAAIVRRWTPDLDRRRGVLAARKVVATAIRAGLAQAGIDPETVPALRRIEQAEPPPAPATYRPDPVAAFYDKMRTIARRCREHPPNLANASPIMLFAMFCFGDDDGPVPVGRMTSV